MKKLVFCAFILTSIAYSGVSKIVYYHVIDRFETEYDFSLQPYDNVVFKTWIIGRENEVLDQNSAGSGYEMLSGVYSSIFIDVGNFSTEWEDGDIVYFLVKEDFGYEGWQGTGETAQLVNDGVKQYNGFPPSDSYPIILDKYYTGISDENEPENAELHQNYPNPFNPETSISFSLPKEEQVTLSVFNMNGQLVKELVNEKKSAGYHSINFNASDLNSGIYFYTLETGSTKLSKKMLFVK